MMPLAEAVQETVMADPLTSTVRLVGAAGASVRVAVRFSDQALSPAVLCARTRYW